MQDLTHRQEKIQQKRKQTSFRDYLMEIASWFPLNLYRNNNNISVFPPNERAGNVAGLKEYYTSYDNILSTSDVPVGENFFQQLQSFFKSHYKPNVSHIATNENCEYATSCFGAKNAYLTFVAGYNAENILYSTQTRENVRNILYSSLVSNGSENIFHSKIITNSYNIFYSAYLYNCSEMRFCSNCIGCHFCIECDGLENASYCVKNQQYTKEEFIRLKNSYLPKQYENLCIQTFSHKAENIASDNVIGT
jgi:hypothetical protein